MSSYNKVIVNGVTKLDLTGDTVKPSAMLAGYSAHGSDGTSITGELFSNRPEQETIIEPMTDSSGLDILDSSGNQLTVGFEYVNKIKYDSEINELQYYIREMELTVEAWRDFVNHTITDSSGNWFVIEDTNIDI